MRSMSKDWFGSLPITVILRYYCSLLLLSMKGVAIGLGRGVQQTLKVQSKRGCRAEATAGSDMLNRLIRRLQQALSQHNALLEHPLMGGRAQGRTEATREGTRAHYGPRCHLLYRELFVHVAGYPCECRADRFPLISARD